jgi:hypothetical protein
VESVPDPVEVTASVTIRRYRRSDPI